MQEWLLGPGCPEAEGQMQSSACLHLCLCSLADRFTGAVQLRVHGYTPKQLCFHVEFPAMSMNVLAICCFRGLW